MFNYLIPEKTTAFTKIDIHCRRIEKSLTLTEGQQPKVFLNKTQITFPDITSPQDLLKALKKLHDMRACIGYTDEDMRAREWSDGCLGHVPFQANNKTVRCTKCLVARKIQKRNESRKTFQERMKEMRNKVKIHAQAATRLTKKVNCVTE